jgi:hypothetical protein
MASTLDKEALQAIDRLDTDYRTLRDNVYPRLARLVQIGIARCEDVRRYNLAMMAVYNAQAALLARLRGASIQNVPASPSFPPLFARLDADGRLAQGAEALFVACPATQPFLGPKDVAPLLTPGPLRVETPFDAEGRFESLPTTFEGFFIPLVVAGIVFMVTSAAVISVWKDSNRDTALAASKLAAVHEEVELRKYAIEAYDTQLVRCGAFDPNTPPEKVRACAEAAKATIDAAKDLESLKELARPKKGLGLLEKIGIATVGVAVILGGFYLYRRSRNKRRASGRTTEAYALAPEPVQG